MMSIFPKDYFEIKKNSPSPFQPMSAYMGGSAFQTIVDNHVTACRQLVQQFAKNRKGEAVDPKMARLEASAIFRQAPVAFKLVLQIGLLIMTTLEFLYTCESS